MNTEFFVVGDSHASVIAVTARKSGAPIRGGAIGAGVTLNDKFVEAVNGDLIFFKEEHKSAARAFKDLLRFRGPVLSTVGFNTHQFAAGMVPYLHAQRMTIEDISRQLFDRIVCDARSGAIEFYQTLVDHNVNVFFTCSPQRFTKVNKTIYLRFEEVLIHCLTKIGARFLDVRLETTANGELLDEFKSTREGDLFHGSPRWAEAVLAKLEQALA